MRRYDGEENGKLIQVRCNQCNKEMKVENGYLKEGCFAADVSFGYFSSRDGVRQRFDLCEECYNKLLEGFQIPVEESEDTELL